MGRPAMNGFATRRLRVEPLDTALAEPARRPKLMASLAALLSEPVTRHLPESMTPGNGPDAIDNWIAAHTRDSTLWLLTSRQDGDLIGLLLLAPEDPSDKAADIHIGYMIAEPFWGKGLATELVSGLVKALSGTCRGRLLGGVAVDNPASAKVLEKTGFTQSATLSTPDTHIYERRIGPE